MPCAASRPARLPRDGADAAARPRVRRVARDPRTGPRVHAGGGHAAPDRGLGMARGLASAPPSGVVLRTWNAIRTTGLALSRPTRRASPRGRSSAPTTTRPSETSRRVRSDAPREARRLRRGSGAPRPRRRGPGRRLRDGSAREPRALAEPGSPARGSTPSRAFRLSNCERTSAGRRSPNRSRCSSICPSCARSWSESTVSSSSSVSAGMSRPSSGSESAVGTRPIGVSFTSPSPFRRPRT